MRPHPSPTPRSASTLRASLAAGVVGLWLLALFLLRADLVDAAFSPYVRCEHCFFWPSLAHDAALLASAFALMAVALMFNQRLLRWSALLVLGALMLICAADVVIFHSLTHRLLWADVLKFARDVGTVGDIGAQSLQGQARTIAIAMAIGGVAIWLATWRWLRQSRPLAWVALTIAAASSVAGWAARKDDPDYVNADISFQNVAEVNFAQSIDARYSDAFVASMKGVPALPQVCAAGQNRHPDIVLVMVESLSAYHSRLYGGELDATPQLDALAASGAWFADFHANGFTTDGGMIALLTGLAPIPLIGRYSTMDAFAGYADQAHSVPASLAKIGYHSLFLTTGDLGFVDKNRWLAAIGFDHFEGAESGFYDGKSRGIFGAARDSLLFDRFAHWYDDERDATKPFFATLLTVTTHPPFIDPENGISDEQGVFREVDAAIAGLHAHLQARGFFDNGLLIVTGDHRAMTPLHAQEYAGDGESAFSRVPMFVWGAGAAAGRIDGLFQHTDLLPSLADITDARACHQSGQGLMLRNQPIAADFVLHARGMPRDHIDVYTDGHRGSLVLAGDRSHWIGDRPAHWQSIEAMIHLQRAEREGGEANVLEKLIEMRMPAEWNKL